MQHTWICRTSEVQCNGGILTKSSTMLHVLYLQSILEHNDTFMKQTTQLSYNLQLFVVKRGRIIKCAIILLLVEQQR